MTRLLPFFVAGCGFSSIAPSTASNCPLHHVVGFFFCDGFEDGLDSRYHGFANHGGMEIDGVHRYRGAAALHLRSDEGTGDLGGTLGPALFADVSDYINIDPAEVHLRVFVYAAVPPFAAALRLMSLGGTQLYLTNADLVLGGLDRAGVAMPLDRWLCLELQILRASSATWVASLRVDGGPPVTMGPLLGDPPLNFSLQLQHNDPTPALDAWFDELVLDHQAVGCGS